MCIRDSACDDAMDVQSSQTPPPPAAGIFASQHAGDISLPSIAAQLQTILQGLFKGYREVDSKLCSFGTKVDAHDSRLAAVEKEQACQFQQSTSRGKAQAVADDRYQCTLVVNGWTENLARAELVGHGRRLLQKVKDAMVVVRQKFDNRIFLVYASQQLSPSSTDSVRQRSTMARLSCGSPKTSRPSTSGETTFFVLSKATSSPCNTVCGQRGAGHARPSWRLRVRWQADGVPRA
eukprot:6049087-Amphidinium_carterae.1